MTALENYAKILGRPIFIVDGNNKFITSILNFTTDTIEITQLPVYYHVTKKGYIIQCEAGVEQFMSYSL